MVAFHEITEKAYSSMPKWLLAAIAAQGEDSKAIQEIVDFSAEMFKLGYQTAFEDWKNKTLEIIARARREEEEKKKTETRFGN